MKGCCSYIFSKHLYMLDDQSSVELFLFSIYVGTFLQSVISIERHKLNDLWEVWQEQIIRHINSLITLLSHAFGRYKVRRFFVSFSFGLWIPSRLFCSNPAQPNLYMGLDPCVVQVGFQPKTAQDLVIKDKRTQLSDHQSHL